MGKLPAVFLVLTLFFTAICKAQDYSAVLPTRPVGNGNSGPPAGVVGSRPMPDESIPEPSTATLFLLGAAAALAFQKRK